VHLVGFYYTKFIILHGHINVKFVTENIYDTTLFFLFPYRCYVYIQINKIIIRLMILKILLYFSTK